VKHETVNSEMKKNKVSDIQLVITIALKKEIPKDWSVARHIPVHTLTALKSGALSQSGSHLSGVLIVITGAGLKASEEAARWIRDNLRPLFVINIGTCGVINKKLSLGKWIKPQYVSNEALDRLELDSRQPIPPPGEIINVHSLISVRKTKFDSLPESWKRHNIIDMECYAQAKVFSNTSISFHCLKFSTDYSDHNTISDFNKNLTLFQEQLKKLFDFISDNPPEITAIVPVYNREQTIQRALDSILSQSYPPAAVIVVDDCSTDLTRKILENYGKKISRIYLPQNSGPSKARNEGIRHARTEWIAFLDSDDCWKKSKLKNQIDYLRKYPFYQILQSEEIWIRNGVRVNPCKHHKKPVGWIFEPSLERCLVSPSGVLIKKSLIEQYGGFNENFPVCEDYDLWLKISRHHPVGLDPNLSVVKYGGHKDQLSRKYPAMDRFRVKSLVRLLENEHDPYFRERIIKVLSKKLNILIRGYEKRLKIKEAQACREILNSLQL
jgi:glycosyltransferase involved in cell wall biosynthesis/nucleoside phosphorylase